MCSREKERRQRKEHEEKMKGRVFIRSDSFACDYHCSVRLMKTHERSRRSHLTSPSGRSSRTSSSHHPISGPSLLVFLPLCRSQSLFVDLGCKSQGVADRVLVSCLLHLSHMEALWRSSDAKIDKAQPAIEIRVYGCFY
ncbi:uncharacterized protein LOC114259050 isoform X2 [Camellia sinensis]|uniref:uncharacterized protein LOC114259050 isoform X2 n=1 Tax=Camellia sinensis TaxID=4442 RepID=UPI001036ACA3|nr:uncharacterized protein LOC114259050 isoform X2 [Camellia sinensis]